MASVVFIMALGLACGGGGESKVTPSPEVTAFTDETKAELIELATSYMQLLTEGDFTLVVDGFSDTLKSFKSEEALQSEWQIMVANNGAFQTITNSCTESLPLPLLNDEHLIVNMGAQFEQSTKLVRFTFDQEKKVSGLFIGLGQSPAGTHGLNPLKPPEESLICPED